MYNCTRHFQKMISASYLMKNFNNATYLAYMLKGGNIKQITLKKYNEFIPFSQEYAFTQIIPMNEE